LEDSRVHYYYQENQERAAARNNGASIAKGRYLNFFDSDDRMYPNHLAAAHAFIANNKEALFFHTGYRVVNEDAIVISVESGVPVEEVENRLITTNYLACNSVFVERQFFLGNLFNIDRRLSSSEDWELWLRLISRTRLYRCSEITFEMLSHRGRSLFNISPDRVVERDTVMLKYLLSDEPFIRKFSRKLDIFKADRFTFFALVFSETPGRRKDAFKHLLESLKLTPKVLGRRRFWASLKHIIFAVLK